MDSCMSTDSFQCDDITAENKTSIFKEFKGMHRYKDLSEISYFISDDSCSDTSMICANETEMDVE